MVADTLSCMIEELNFSGEDIKKLLGCEIANYCDGEYLKLIKTIEEN